MVAIQTEHIGYRVHGKTLLQDISFALPQGKMLAILGANGAGKSTLMKLLCKEMLPDAGTIRIYGKALSSYPLAELARFRSVLSQQHTLSISFRVDELVMMGRYPHFGTQPTPQDYAIVQQVMEQTGVLGYAERDYNTLSGGEQQRVQLARVIAQIHGQPQGILFLDEPTNGLDLLYQQHILKFASALKEQGQTVVSILHDVNFACQYADYIMLLHKGKVIAYGAPEEVIDEQNMEKAFQVQIRKIPHPDFKCPLVFPV